MEAVTENKATVKMSRKILEYFSLGRGGMMRTETRELRRILRHRLQNLKSRPSRLASQATFIGVTGSSGKTTTAALLSNLLGAIGATEDQVDHNTLSSIAPSIGRINSATEYFVAEAGVGTKGDMGGIADIIRPDVAIVTLIELEHYSVFRKKEAVAAEKCRLVKAVQKGGLAVLNADDEHVMAMSKQTNERIVTFGREQSADFQVVSVESRFPEPLRMTIAWDGKRTELTLPLIGEQFWVSVAAAFAAAIELGVDVDEIVARCAKFEPMPNRCQIHAVDGGPKFILDTVKAPWHSLPLAFKVVETAAAPRKRIVLGNMSDMTSSNLKYRDAYRMAREICDQVIFVGEHSHRSKASEEDRLSQRFVEAKSVNDVRNHLRKTAIEGEIILLKSSANLKLERVVTEWDTV